MGVGLGDGRGIVPRSRGDVVAKACRERQRALPQGDDGRHAVDHRWSRAQPDEHAIARHVVRVLVRQCVHEQGRLAGALAADEQRDARVLGDRSAVDRKIPES